MIIRKKFYFSEIQCGRLHCTHESEKLAFGDPSTVHTAYMALRLHNGKSIACRVAWTKYFDNKGGPDPGMVPNGAVCGKDRVLVFILGSGKK